MTPERGNPINAEPAFVLHALPWRETSQLVEMLTRNHGRLPLIAKGARRPRSEMRGVLQPFQPLLISWFGRSEVRTLKAAEWQGGIPLLSGSALFCGFYLNELLIRLLVRDDPHPDLFDAYQSALVQLAARQNFEPVLRRFEMALLREMGYAPRLDVEADTDSPVEPTATYRVLPELGVVRSDGPAPNTVQFSGKTLLDMAQDSYDDPQTLTQAKQLMRQLLAHHLGDRDLNSRRIFQELPTL